MQESKKKETKNNPFIASSERITRIKEESGVLKKIITRERWYLHKMFITYTTQKKARRTRKNTLA